MSNISATNSALPVTTTGATGGATTPANASGTATATDQAAAQAALSKPDPTYPNLTALHVGVLQAIGTPANLIAEINARKPDPTWLDSYIQNEIMQSPEGWDAYTKNPAGTARAALTQLFPGITLPAAGAGVGTMPSDGPATSIPGVNTPLLAPDATPVGSNSGTEDLIRMLVIGAAVVGVGLLVHHFVKGGGGGANAAKDVLAGVTEVGAKPLSGFAKLKAWASGGFGGGVHGWKAGGKQAKLMAEAITGGGSASLLNATAANNANLYSRTLALQALERGDQPGLTKAMILGLLNNGSPIGAVAGAESGGIAATAHAIMSGLGPADNTVTSLGLASAATGMPLREIMEFHLAEKALDVQKAIAMAGVGVGDDGARTAAVGAQALLGAIGRIAA